jgi:hypothetical protein
VTRARAAIALFALFAGVAACAPWLSIRLPYKSDHIKVPHALHANGKVECIACHDELYDAKDLEKRVLPAESKCLECHREQKSKGQCSFCHTDVGKAEAWPARTPTLRMSHAGHIDRVKEDCHVCHKTLPNPLRAEDATPPMSACLSCHEHRRDYDEGRCSVCHLDLARFPLKPVSLFSHQGNFVREHGRSARAAEATCAQCHEQTFCSDCHANTVSLPVEWKFPERVDANFIHRNDFIDRHAVESQADPASCRRCHGTTFCADCHRKQNLTPQAQNPRDPHPNGWSFPGSAQFHGTEARRDINQCAACHDQGARSVCVDCHKVGGIGGDPHPLGWSSRHGRGEITHSSMCLACHS